MEKVIELLKKYLETRFELFKIKTEQELYSILGHFIKLIIFVFTGLTALLFLSATLALIINHFLESKYIGFALITIIYLLFFLYLISKRGQSAIEHKINLFNSQFLKREKEEDNQ